MRDLRLYARVHNRFPNSIYLRARLRLTGCGLYRQRFQFGDTSPHPSLDWHAVFATAVVQLLGWLVSKPLFPRLILARIEFGLA